MTETRATSISGTDSTRTSASDARRRRTLGWGLTLVGVALCMVLAWSAPGSLLEAFERIRLGPAALAVGLMVATRVVDAWLLAHLFSEQRGAIGFRPAIRIVTLQNLSAFVAPKSGLVAAAAVLKIEHGIGLARFTGIQTAALAIKAVITASVGLAAAISIRLTVAEPESTTALDIVIVALASIPPLVMLCYLVASRTTLTGPGRIRSAFADAWLGIVDLYRDRRRLLWILALSIVTAALKIVGFMVVVHGVIGEIASPIGVVVVSTAAELGTALSFTPAGLGVREATAGLTARLAGITAPVMIGIALVDRALMLTTTGILSPTLLLRSTTSTHSTALDSPTIQVDSEVRSEAIPDATSEKTTASSMPHDWTTDESDS